MAGKVRQPIDEAAFDRFVAENVPQIKRPTELVTGADGQRFVMRKKPPGRLLSKTAHKVEREYRILHALEATEVPVPKTYCLCEDESVLGTAFYVMEYLDGRIFEDPRMPGVGAEERGLLWRAAVDTLARLHAVDVDAVGLGSFGKRSAICARQEAVADVKTGQAVGRLPHFDETVAFFRDGGRQPRDRATLVHGDYKIDNVVFHKTEARVIGVLDWEMSTVGHPLSDLCNLLTPLYTAGEAAAGVRATPGFLAGPTTAGVPTAAEVVGRYGRASGYDAGGELAWGMAFGLFRLAAVCQGIAARQAARQASSAQARRYLAELAWRLAREAGARGARERL